MNKYRWLGIILLVITHIVSLLGCYYYRLDLWLLGVVISIILIGFIIKKKVEDNMIKVIVAMLILGFMLIPIICAHDYIMYEAHLVYDSTLFKCYTVTAPFGVFVIKGEGSMGGFIIAFHGSFDFDLAERYVVKFFDGEELKTKIFDAEQVSIVVDGTFNLEKISKFKARYSRSNGEFNGVISNYADNWVIHIPALPEVNQTTAEWIIP